MGKVQLLSAARAVSAAVVFSWLAGCASIALERAKVEPLKSVELVRVQTPPLQLTTFMQAWANSPQSGWLIQGIASEQPRAMLAPPAIPDMGAAITAGLKAQLPKQVAWWPQITDNGAVVPQEYVHQGGPWLRVEVMKLELAPPPLRTVFAVVDVSLRSPKNEPIWVERKAFSGVVHGGEKIDVDKLPDDLSQVQREVDRAVQWLIREIAATVK